MTTGTRSGTRVRLRLRLTVASLLMGIATVSLAVLPASVASASPVGPLFAASVAQGVGDCTSPATACTLTTALGDVAAGGTIELVTPGSSAHYVGTFTLSTGTVGSPVTIEPAAGISDPTLDGNNGSATNCPTTSCLASVLTVASGVYATVSGVTVENGLTAPGGNGGGIDNAGNLTLTNDIVTENVTGPGDGDSEEDGGGGGGIYNTGTLALTDDTVADNQTGAGNSLGSITIDQNGDNSSINIAATEEGADGGNGGGIDSAGALTLTDDTVSGNQTGAGGSVGAISITQSGQNDSVSLDNTEDGADGGNGGGVYNSGTLSLADDTVAGNQTGAGGSLASISITQKAGSFASAGVLFSDNGADGGDGGGIYNTAALTLTNDTVADNGTGAGADPTGASFTLVQDGADAAAHSDDGQGGVGGQGGDIDNDGTANVAATIVASSGAGNDCAGRALTDQGYNIDSDGSCSFTGTGSVSNSTTLNASLDTLGPHGGPTDTIAISSGPAIDLVHSATLCATADQRGVERPSLVCDAGAYEYTAANASIAIAKSANVGSYSGPGTPITYSYKVTDTGNLTLTNVTVTDPMSGLSPINCGGATNTVATLAPGSSVTCTAGYTTAAADVEAGSLSNTGTVVGTPPVGSTVTNSSPLTIPAKPCGPGLTPHFLTATTSGGNFFGIFCVNAAGTGSYTQFSAGPTVKQTASGTGTIKVSRTTTTIDATGSNLALLGQKTPTSSSVTETAPAPMKSGTFTLT